MELIFILLGGFVIGAIARYSLPNREYTGALLLPIFAAAFAGVVWEILVWLQFSSSNPWPWIITFVLTAVKSVGLDLWLARRRKRADAQAYDLALRG